MKSDLKKITHQKFVKNYSVKSEKDKTLISGIAIFQTKNDKEQFLNEWSSKINSYSVDLDENN